jgi:predicted O-linked N-acetylglucosamine transferase (SPINDLY family)
VGVPLVTAMGRSFQARVAASILKAIGLPELITDNFEDYEKLALALATDPARLAALREKLAANRRTTALFDTSRFTGNLEAAYERMRENWAAAEPGLP